MRRAGVVSNGVDAEVATVLSLTSAGLANANIFSINNVVVSGVGTSPDPWGPV